MSRGANGRGTRGAGKVARSESPQVRAIMSQKSIDIKNVGNLVKAKAYDEASNKDGGDIEPTPELLKMAGREMGDAERTIANANVEHSAIYDEDGKQIMVKTSNDPALVFFSPKELKAMKGRILTHNHPTGPNGLPIPFSRADVTLMHFTKAKEFRAVSGNTAFSISPPKDSKFWKMKEPAVDKMLNKAREIAFAELGIKDEESRRNASIQQLAKALDTMLTIVDRQLNLGYKKTNL